MEVDQQIASVVKPDSIGAVMAYRVRRKIYGKLSEVIDLEALDTILDVGVTADEKAAYSNFFESFYPHKERITALSDQDAVRLEKLFPGLRFVQGDGCALPFGDRQFDLVFSSAVLEHVGSHERQKAFIKEACRVSRKWVFLTTPNRWHIFEFHTYWPFIHWLPKSWHRKLLKWLKMDYLSEESSLNLLGKRDLEHICRDLAVDYKILHVRFLALPSNLLLVIRINNN